MLNFVALEASCVASGYHFGIILGCFLGSQAGKQDFSNNVKNLSCDVPQPLFQKMPFENGWYYVGSATQGRDYIMIQPQSVEARSRQGLVGLAQAPSPQESAKILLFTLVSAQA